jgi:hypothetical protein
MVDAMEAWRPLIPRRAAVRHRGSLCGRVATGMASFDKGVWRLLSYMIAQVHQGEMIISTDPAVTLRRMMGGKQGSRRHGA